ncbi:hypothetical protein BGCPKDLD_4075 [Methylorubrum suomiense]|uniref:Uncharacterized protein n=1 Tax=Methylorubrum suomiense TaxID=144191 RepID=A0ABQ4V076_9HYPH|nr:hypothetical protein BGCPKDLD_4075 [Methylorubrum suomiense]
MGVVSAAGQCPRIRGGQCLEASEAAMRRKTASTASVSAFASPATARTCSAVMSNNTAELVVVMSPSRITDSTDHISLRYGQFRGGFQLAIGISPAARSTILIYGTGRTLRACCNFGSRSGGFGLPCAAGALKPPSVRRAPLSNRAGMTRPVASMAPVSDGRRRLPSSHRPHDASVALLGTSVLDGFSRDCRSLRAPALLFPRARRRLAASSGRACVPRAFVLPLHPHVLPLWFEVITGGFAGVQKAFAGGANE